MVAGKVRCAGVMHDDTGLRDLMVKMHDRSYGACGAPKVTAELRLGLGGCLPRGDHHDRCDGFDACSSKAVQPSPFRRTCSAHPDLDRHTGDVAAAPAWISGLGSTSSENSF